MASSLPVPTGCVLDDILPDAHRMGPSGGRVTGCTSDWQAVQPGDVFVALLDASGDGHEMAQRAAERGAAALICERPTPVFNVPTYLVEDSRVALGEICQALADYPADELKVIGVAGTLGKSTTIALLESIFANWGEDAAVLSSLKSYDGVSCGPGIGESLSPTALASKLAHASASGCRYAVVEVSSQTLAEGKLAGVELDSLCYTQVTSGRLELHQSAENYRSIVHRALDHLSEDGVAVFNGDDPVNCRWLAGCNRPSLTYGCNDQAQVTADVIERNANETVLILTAGDESAAVRTRLVGDHHVENCLAAATVALAYGVDMQSIAAGIESCPLIPARMQRVDCGQEFAVFIDAASTADSLRAALRSARSLASNRVICVVGDELPHSRHETTAIHSVLKKLADIAVVTEVLTQTNECWALAGGVSSRMQIAADRAEAIGWAMTIADPGDVVVVAGGRGRTELGFGRPVAQVTDADAVREMLYARVHAQPALRLVA